MDLPKRHPNHIIENECNKYFCNCVPNEWFEDKPDNDYGIDYIVNIVVNNQVTGLNFSVQLKSVHKSSGIKPIPIKLKASTLNLFHTRLEPTMLIVYSKEDGEAYWVWYNELDIDLSSQKRIYTIKIPLDNKLSCMNWDSITSYVQNTFSYKLVIDSIKELEYSELTNTEILAWKAYYTADYHSSSFYFRKALDNNMGNVINLREALSHSLYMEGKYVDALVIVEELLRQRSSKSILLLKASILTERGLKIQSKNLLLEAKHIFGGIIENTPELNAVYHYNYANALSYLGNLLDAEKYYKIALSINPAYAEAWKNLGGIYYQLKKHEKEIDCYNRALSINPNLLQALFSKGITLTSIFKKHQEALSLMTKAINLDGSQDIINDFPRGYYWLAYVSLHLNSLEDAYRWIQSGLLITPDDEYLDYLKFNFLAQYWSKELWIKREASSYFEMKYKAYNDYGCLYFYIIINDLPDDKILSLLREYIPALKELDLKSIFNISDLYVLLKHYSKYVELRKIYPINRYVDNLISGDFVVQSCFWNYLDVVLAYAFSSYITEYEKNGEGKMDDALSIALNKSADIAQFIVKAEDFQIAEIAAIAARIIIGFPIIIMREYGVQKGYVRARLGLAIDEDLTLPEEWFSDLQEKIAENTLVSLGVPRT